MPQTSATVEDSSDVWLNKRRQSGIVKGDQRVCMIKYQRYLTVYGARHSFAKSKENNVEQIGRIVPEGEKISNKIRVFVRKLEE